MTEKRLFGLSIRPLDMLVFALSYPLMALVSPWVTLWGLVIGNIVAVFAHAVDLVRELAVSRQLSSQTRRGKEKVEQLLSKVLSALRVFAAVAICFSLQFTVLALFFTAYSIISALFFKDSDTFVSRTIRGVANFLTRELLGKAMFPAASDARASSDRSVKGTSGEARQSSLRTGRGSAAARCKVLNEGPHFNRTARGFLL